MNKAGLDAVEYPFDVIGIRRDSDEILRFDGVPSTYTEILQHSVERNADRPAIVDRDGTSLSFDELWDKVCAVAGGFYRAGLRPGDRVCVDLPNSAAFVVSFLAATVAGGVGVPIDQRASDSQRQAMIADADPRIVVSADNPAPSGNPFVHQPNPDDLAQLLYTSGTSGRPKGVMATQRNLSVLGEITARTLLIDRTDPRAELRNLVVIPLCHAAGCNSQLLPTLALGGTLVIAPSSKPADFVDSALRNHVDTVLAVPAIFSLLVEREAERLKALATLRRVIYGTAPMPRWLIEQLRELVPDVKLGNAYGMTEISNIALYLPDNLTLTHHDSVGFAVPTIEAKIDNPNEAGLGELYLRGPNMAAGYWRNPEQTASVFGTGWVKTGDIAVIDSDGLVYIRDRANDMINRGGEKIFSIEVEQALQAHPNVMETAVIAVPDRVMGEKVGAVVVLQPGADLDENALREYAATQLSKYCVPEYIVISSDRLPRGSSGKILKAQLKSSLGWTAS